MNPERVLKRLSAVAVLFFGSVIVVAAASEPDELSGTSARPPATSEYSHNDLQLDATMTQQMSAPNANTDSQIHVGDPQQRRSQRPGYVSALEQHQANIDRMLAR